MLNYPQFHVGYLMGLGICLYIDILLIVVELRVLCDFGEKPSIGCRILRDFFMSSMG